MLFSGFSVLWFGKSLRVGEQAKTSSGARCLSLSSRPTAVEGVRRKGGGRGGEGELFTVGVHRALGKRTLFKCLQTRPSRQWIQARLQIAKAASVLAFQQPAVA